MATKEEISMVGFEIVAYAGDAQTDLLAALDAAREGDFEKAEQLHKDASDALIGAHDTQTKLLSQEAGGGEMEMTFIMAHAQDTLMTTMILEKQTRFTIDAYKRIAALRLSSPNELSQPSPLPKALPLPAAGLFCLPGTWGRSLSAGSLGHSCHAFDPLRMEETGSLGLLRCRLGLSVTKLCRFTTMNRILSTMERTALSKPQVESLSFSANSKCGRSYRFYRSKPA